MNRGMREEGVRPTLREEKCVWRSLISIFSRDVFSSPELGYSRGEETTA
jgi:hypothetical protein